MKKQKSLTEQDRKLAEKILKPIKFDDPEGGENVGTVDAMYAMQAYHEAKIREELIKYTIWHQDMIFKCHALAYLIYKKK